MYSPMRHSWPPQNFSTRARLAAARDTSACFDVVRSPIKYTHQCFQHTEPTPKQKAVNSLERWRARRFAECRHESLSVGIRLPLWLPPTAPVAPRRFACVVVGSIEAIRRASMSQCRSICSPMHRPAGFAAQTPSGRRIGSLFVRFLLFHSAHCAGRRPCSLWRCQHSQALRPAPCSR